MRRSTWISLLGIIFFVVSVLQSFGIGSSTNDWMVILCGFLALCTAEVVMAIEDLTDALFDGDEEDEEVTP